MSLTVPFRPSSQQRPHGDVPAAGPPAPLRLGALDLRSVLAYLLLWTVVLFAVEVLVAWSSHEALARTGVLASISRAVATVLDEPLPASGVLPELEFSALLPWVLLGAVGLAVLWLLTLLAVVLVHNGICAVTGGPRVRTERQRA
jgi:Transmembrane domain of unknown function (DUF3566)